MTSHMKRQVVDLIPDAGQTLREQTEPVERCVWKVGLGGSSSVRLVKADVSAQTFVKVGFAVERRLTDGGVDFSGSPEWRSRPDNVRLRFEVLARVDGNKVVPERVSKLRKC